MKGSHGSIKRKTTIVAAFVSLVLALVPPAIYFFMSYAHMRGVVDTEGEINARLVGTFVVANPRMWQFEELRLQELLARRSQEGGREVRRIYGLKGEVIAESADPLPPPLYTRFFEIYDAGHPVARLQVSRSLAPTLLVTSLVLCCGLVAGGFAFFRLRTVPLRAIDQADRIVRASEEKYRSVYQSLREGLALFRTTAHPEGGEEFTLIDLNPSCLGVFGFDRGDIGRSISEVCGGILAREVPRIAASVAALGEASLELQHERLGKVFTLKAFRVGEGMAALLLEDVTEKKRTAEQLEKLAYYDSLTGLLNRRMLLDRLDQTIAVAQRKGNGVGVFFIDLDGFKVINDTLGHEAGDQILMEVAGRLQGAVRKSDTLARLGGDEFVVVASFEQEQNTGTIANNLLKRITPVYQVCGREVYVGASIGISVFPEDGDRPETLLKNADIAMYNAKSASGMAFCFYSADLNEKLHQRMRLEFALRRAVERDEFLLEFQPIIEVRSGRISAVEALLRWMDPEKGRVMPDAFIPLAEETGIILPLGEWVLHNACLKLRQWHDLGLPPVRMCVNISGRQFMQGDLLRAVDEAMLVSGIDPALLELELTETCLIQNVEETTRKLCNLKGFNISIAIDDFGTGYSSLQYLKDFPIDHLKIDRAFTKDACEAPDHRAIVDAIIGIAKAMGLQVIAEGVETREQAEYLAQRGCDEFQGFYFFRPLSEEQLIEVLQAEKGRGEGGEGTALAR